MKKLVCLLLFLSLALSAFAGAGAEAAGEPERLCFGTFLTGEWSYHIQEDGTIVIIGYDGPSSLEKQTVPAEIDGIPVTAIRHHAFYLSKLKEIEIPEGVTTLGDAAFQGSSSLVSVSLPASLTDMGRNPFERCKALENIAIADGNTSFIFRNGMLISLADQHLVYADMKLKGKVTVPDGILAIGAYAFSGCTDITAFSFPKSLTAMEDGAFQSCLSVSAPFVIPAGVTTIGEGLFFNALKVVKNGQYVPVPITVEESNPVLEMVDGALIDQSTHRLVHYNDCSVSDETYVVPEGITRIGSYAFSSFHKSGVILPQSLTEIGANAFRGCRIKEIVIPSGVVKIDHYAFTGCHSLESVTLPEGLQQAAKDAFHDCPNLPEVTWPEDVEFLEFRYRWEMFE